MGHIVKQVSNIRFVGDYQNRLIVRDLNLETLRLPCITPCSDVIVFL